MPPAERLGPDHNGTSAGGDRQDISHLNVSTTTGKRPTPDRRASVFVDPDSPETVFELCPQAVVCL